MSNWARGSVIFLTFVHLLAAHADPVRCENVLTLGSALETANNEYIAKGDFNQKRGFLQVMREVNGLKSALQNAAPGEVVLDLGCGFGMTIGSIFHPRELADSISEQDFENRPEYWPEQAHKFSHLSYIGVTLTEAGKMVVPLDDPQGHFKIFAGRRFDQVPVDELLRSFGKKISVAYDDIGVFAYSSRPDLDLVKLAAVLREGGRAYIRYGKNGAQATIQTPEGELISLADYIRIYGQKFFEISVEDSALILTRTSSSETASFPELELVGTQGELPGLRYFRVLDRHLSGAQRLANENGLWDRVQPERRMDSFLLSPMDMYAKWTKDSWDRNIEIAFGEYAPFAKQTVFKHDRFAATKAFLLNVAKGHDSRSLGFFKAHQKEILTGSDYDGLILALVEILQTRGSPRGLEKLKDWTLHLSHEPNDWVAHAYAENAASPFTPESLLGSLVSGRTLIAVPDGFGTQISPERRRYYLAADQYGQAMTGNDGLDRWGAIKYGATQVMTPSPTPEQVESFHSLSVMVEYLRMAWQDNPIAWTWLTRRGHQTARP